MKAKLLRDLVIRNRKYMGDTGRRLRHALVRRHRAGELTRKQLRDELKEVAAKGTVIDHPRAFHLVQLGVAEPVDTACKIAAAFSEQQIAAAVAASEQIEAAQALSDEQNASDEAATATRRKRTGK